jgi:hypothetical protein
LVGWGIIGFYGKENKKNPIDVEHI